ncbi:AhpC/TSA family protein [Flavobacteriaceae bacterium MAR_2010_72]|nr:AhpC/TSA family protein [Flavobacteriaceae bacterium MAR_2010_72]TVZ59315.1 AhpC/TSA family protein [Flavobacteriaceae bacterium MAR_2010_105]
MRPLFTILSFGYALLAFPQDSKVYFDDALTQHLPSYNIQSKIAINNYDFKQADSLFSLLLKNHLKNTYIPNLKLNKISGETIETDSLKNPFLLITKASWNLQDKREIRAINDMAELYKGQIDVIVLYWDSKKVVKSLEKQYNDIIHLVYSDESENKSSYLIKTFKHSFGVPACFFISGTKQLVDLNKKFELYQEISNPKSSGIASTYRNLALLLFKNEMSKKGTITTLDEDTSH